MGNWLAQYCIFLDRFFRGASFLTSTCPMLIAGCITSEPFVAPPFLFGSYAPVLRRNKKQKGRETTQKMRESTIWGCPPIEKIQRYRDGLNVSLHTRKCERIVITCICKCMVMHVKYYCIKTEVEERTVGAELVFQPPPTPPPWSKHFSSHPRRVLCTLCFSGNREIWNAKCSDCYRIEREEFKKQKERNLKK
jgi:hypothetical protein